jgi:hypothetical protein
MGEAKRNRRRVLGIGVRGQPGEVVEDAVASEQLSRLYPTEAQDDPIQYGQHVRFAVSG